MFTVEAISYRDIFFVVYPVISRKEGVKMKTTGHGRLVGIYVKPP